jgi:rRNA maturation endonuclease Nob1
MGGLQRCDGCGTLTWSVLGRPGDGACPDCGEPLKVERRRPGRRFGRKVVERRDVAPPAQPAK